MLQLSPSKINDIMICTARYYYGRILRLPRRPTFITVYGSIIDKTVEQMLIDKMNGGVKVFHHYATHAKTLMESMAEGIDMTDDERKDWWWRIHSVILNYYDNELATVRPVATQFVNEYQTDFFRVYQIFDLIADGPVVIDYKAPIKRFRPVKGVWQPKSFSHVIQLWCYHHGYCAAFGEYPKGLELHYLLPPEKMSRSVKPAEIVKVPVCFSVVDDDVEFLVRDAYEKILNVEAGEYVPNRAKTNFLCSRKWCDFWKRCEEEFGGTVRG